MRFLKQQSTNTRGTIGTGIRYTTNNQAVIDGTEAIVVPIGTTGQRPSSAINGQIRYNTTNNEFEVYENNEWKNLRYAEPNPVGITQQNVGTGDHTYCFHNITSIMLTYLYTSLDILEIIENRNKSYGKQ